MNSHARSRCPGIPLPSTGEFAICAVSADLPNQDEKVSVSVEKREERKVNRKNRRLQDALIVWSLLNV